MVRSAALLLAVCLFAPTVLAQDSRPAQSAPQSESRPATVEPPAIPHDATWNQWRGPARDGRFVGPTWPRGLELHLARRWFVPLGPSYSGPVVDAEYVYTTETVDEEFEIARALRRSDGSEVWSTRWKGSLTVPPFAARNGSWIRATPVVVDGRLYVAGIRDVLVCLATDTGETQWRVDFTERFESPLPAFGFVSSPIVENGSVYVQAGAAVVKLDAETGETQWRALRDDGGMFGSAFGSPVIGEVGGVRQLVVQTRSELAGLALEDGEVLWRQPVRSERGMAILTPTLWDGDVFTSAYGGRGQRFDIVEADGGADGSGEAGDATATPMRSVEVWTSRAQGYMTSPVVIDGHAYLYLRSKRFTCVDLATGETTWTSTNMGDEYWSLVAGTDRILALTNAGELLLIEADPTEFRVIESFVISQAETWAHLAIDGEQVFVREQDGLAMWGWDQ